MKLCNALVRNIFNRSHQVTLPWRAQNFVVIGWTHFKPKHCEFWSNYEFDQNTVSGTGARWLKHQPQQQPLGSPLGEVRILQAEGCNICDMLKIPCSMLNESIVFHLCMSWATHQVPVYFTYHHDGNAFDVSLGHTIIAFIFVISVNCCGQHLVTLLNQSRKLLK